MDPARPGDPDPADPFFAERADHAILEKIEMRREGVFLKNWMIRDNWRDAFLYAMLDSEWRKIEEPKVSPVTRVIHLERRTAT